MCAVTSCAPASRRRPSTDIADVRAALGELQQDGEKELAAAGFAPERRRFAASLDMRYLGQSFELSVPVALDVASIKDIERAFSEVYAARYGGTNDAVIEIVSYRLAAWGLSEKPTLPPIDRAGRSRVSGKNRKSRCYFLRQGAADARSSTGTGCRPAIRAGPALIEEGGSTTVVPPGWSVALDDLGCLVFKRS